MMVSRRLAALAFGFTLAIAAGAWSDPARAQTPEQVAACQYDAQTYCGQFIPDHEMIRRCLVRNMNRISPACRAQFKRSRRR